MDAISSSSSGPPADLAYAAIAVPGRPSWMPRAMNALDVLLLPSRTTARWKEQFGRVVIEAQACRVPVIGSDSGAIPEVVGDGGLIVPERDPAALAAAIQRLANDPVGRAEMGRAGYERVHAQFTWQRVAGQMADIYRNVCGLTPAEVC